MEENLESKIEELKVLEIVECPMKNVLVRIYEDDGCSGCKYFHGIPAKSPCPVKCGFKAGYEKAKKTK